MKRSKDQNQLFLAELDILQQARAIVRDISWADNPLLSHYESLSKQYEKLLRQSSKLMRISDAQQKNLQKVEKDMRNLLDHAGQGFLSVGPDLLVNKEYSAECLQIFGEKIENKNIIELLFPGYEQKEKEFLIKQIKSLWTEQQFANDLAGLRASLACLEIKARYYWVEYRFIDAIQDEGDQKLIMLMITDITERQKAEQEVRYLSFHDKLTGLYNRSYIDIVLQDMNDEDKLPVSLIMGDVNGLKIANDVFGHQEGDRLLQNIAAVLRKCLRADDLIARWGGDEFLIILPRTDEFTTELVCKQIQDSCVASPAEPIKLSISLGMATRNSIKDSLADIFRYAEDRMYSNKQQDHKQVRQDIILAMEKKLKDKHLSSADRIERMTALAIALAHKMGLTERQVEEMAMLVQMHDIGNVSIPVEILQKPGPLDMAEWEMVKKHTEIACRMAQAISENRLAEQILAHHEHWDGSGYPQGLKAHDIPMAARIMAIIDAYEVMTQGAVYKTAITSRQAVEELQRCSGTQFDPEIVKVLIDLLVV